MRTPMDPRMARQHHRAKNVRSGPQGRAWTVALGGIVLLAAAVGSAEAGDDLPLGLRPVRIPDDNPMSEAKIKLGKQLYFDPRLSSDGTVSCATCHDPDQGWSNGEAVATGVGGQKGNRSAPTIINAAYNYFQFWDGRAPSLEEQAKGPIQNPIEMDMTKEAVEKKINSIPGYRKQFQQVFGDEATLETVARAIAAYERTVLSGNAPYDRYKDGDTEALSDSARRGMELFFGKAHCSACHTGFNFTDNGFHNIGIGMDQENPDPGRTKISGLEGDTGAFKTPTLREIAKTAPYMHDGSLKTLEEVVDYYDKGGVKNPYLDEEITELGLSDEEKSDLITFLKEGLSSPDYPNPDPPKLPE